MKKRAKMKNVEEMSNFDVIEIMMGLKERHDLITYITRGVLKLEEVGKEIQAEIEEKKQILKDMSGQNFDDLVEVLEALGEDLTWIGGDDE